MVYLCDVAIILQEIQTLNERATRRLAVRRNVGLGSPTNSQPGRLRYVVQASGLRVLAASSRQFWWYFQDAPEPRKKIPTHRTSEHLNFWTAI